MYSELMQKPDQFASYGLGKSRISSLLRRASSTARIA